MESEALALAIERDRISLPDLIAELTLPEMNAQRRVTRAEEVRAAVEGLLDAGLLEPSEDSLSPTRPARRAGELELGLQAELNNESSDPPR